MFSQILAALSSPLGNPETGNKSRLATSVQLYSGRQAVADQGSEMQETASFKLIFRFQTQTDKHEHYGHGELLLQVQGQRCLSTIKKIA